MFILTPAEKPNPQEPLEYIHMRMINDAAAVMKGRGTEEGSYQAAG